MFGRSFQRDSTQLLLLSVLSEKPLYGYAITKQVAARSRGELKMTPGVLYPLLARLERSGLVASSWEVIRSERRTGGEGEAEGAEGEDGGGRKRKWYRLTPKGRRRLVADVKSHQEYVSMLQAFLPPPAEGKESSA